MLAKLLKSMEYDARGRNWSWIDVISPNWDATERALRRLEKFRYPYVWLYLESEPGNRHPDFEIMGGKGDYWIAGSVGGHFQRRYLNPSPTEDDEVKVWTSDLGFADDDRFICHDLDTVLRVTKYFCEFGTFDPSVTWEAKSRPKA